MPFVFGDRWLLLGLAEQRRQNLEILLGRCLKE